MSSEEIKALVARVKANLRVTKIVAVRSVRGKMGDTQAGFTAELPLSDGGSESMSLREAVVATVLLGREADIAAYRNAVAGGNIPFDMGKEAIASVKGSYAKVIAEALDEVEKIHE